MKTKAITIGIVLMAMVLVPLTLAAEDNAAPAPRGGQGGPGGEPREAMRGGMMGDMQGRMMMQQLDLTEEQQAKIKAIQEENRTQMQDARKAVQEANQALQEAIESGTDDQIMAAGKALGEAYGKEGVLRAQTQRKINAVLTPEQQAKMKELKTQMRDRMQQRMQDRPAGEFRGGPGAAGQGGRPGRDGQRNRAPQEE